MKIVKKVPRHTNYLVLFKAFVPFLNVKPGAVFAIIKETIGLSEY